MIERFSGRTRAEDRVEAKPTNGLNLDKLQLGAQAVRSVTMTSTLADYIHRIMLRSREHPDILLGGSPRAALHLALAAKFQASIANRTYVIPDDVKAVARPLLAHRLVFKAESYERVPFAVEVVDEILSQVPVPEKVVE